MKNPILTNALTVTDDIKPLFSRGVYNVYVGALEEDQLPMYVVINRDSGVVEFTNEVIWVVNGWLDHFLKEPAANEPNFEADGGQIELGLN